MTIKVPAVPVASEKANASNTGLQLSSQVRSVRTRAHSFRSLNGASIVLVVLFIIGALYSTFYLDEVLTGRHWADACIPGLDGDIRSCNNQLHDSIAYLTDSKSLAQEPGTMTAILMRSDFAQGAISTGIFDNLILYIQGAIAYKVFPFAPQLFIFTSNFLLLLQVARRIEGFAERAGMTLSPWSTVLLLGNPLILVSCVSLTKEIWGMFFICEMVVAAQRRSFVRLGVLSIASIFARFFYGAFGLIYYALVRPRKKWIRVVVVIAVMFGLWYSTATDSLEMVNLIRSSRSSDTGQDSAAIMAKVYSIQAFPLGDVVTYPLLFVGNALSALTAPFRLNTDSFGVYWYAVIGSSACFAAAFGRIIQLRLYRLTKWRHQVWDLILAVFLYTFLEAHLPFLQHRYLLPIWPLLGLIAFGRPRDYDDIVATEKHVKDNSADIAYNSTCVECGSISSL